MSFFSFFDYPMTAFEVWKWQYRPERIYTLEEIYRALKTLCKRGAIQQYEGFFAIKHVEEQVLQRKQRYTNALAKHRKVKRILSYIARIPTVKGVAVCNSLPLHFTDVNSDIDLFIITKPGHVWMTRFLCVLPFMLFRQRPGERSTHPVDMTFFVSEKALALQYIRTGKDDIYFSYWLSSLLPVYEAYEGIFEKVKLSNAWVEEDFPCVPVAKLAAFWRTNRTWKFPLWMPEHVAKWLSYKRFPQHIQEMLNTDTRVIVNDDMLKFHTKDRRKAIEGHMHVCENYIQSTGE